MTINISKGEFVMKVPFIITPQSFVSKSYIRLMEIIPYLNSGDRTYKAYFFCDAHRFAEIIGAVDNYNAIVNALEKYNVEHSELSVYGWDELFYLLAVSEKFQREIGYKGELYCSPSNATYYIAVSAGTVGYSGKIKTYLNFNNYTGKIFFKDNDYKSIANNPRWSTTGLDRKKIEYLKDADYSECYYTIDGKIYYEKPLTRKDCHNAGTQGYTYVSRQSGYRLKFWDYPGYYYQFQIDKIEKMIYDPSPNNIAVPKAIIYSKNDIAIGIIMENFNGDEPLFENYSQALNHPLRCMQSLMSALITAEAYSYIHRDFWHNIIFSDSNFQAYLIDIDTVQYANYPATAYSAENRSCLPDRYTINGNYYSTVELSYWAAIMSISSVIIPNPRRGDCIIEQGTKQGLYKLNAGRYNELKAKAPHIADVALRQYDECFPTHPLRILMAIERDRKVLPFDSVFSNLKVYFAHVPDPELEEHIEFEHNRGDYAPCESDKISSNHDETNDGTKTYHTIVAHENNKVKQSFPNPDIDFTNTNQNPNPVPIVKSRMRKSLKDNKIIAKICKLYKMIIVKLFMKSLGTASVDYDSSIPEEELYEKQYKLFIAKKLYKRPLITSIILIAISIGLLIAANIM